MKSLCLVLAWLVLLPAQLFAGSTFYVKKTGSNSFSCLQAQNPATPRLTITATTAPIASGGCTTANNGDIVEVDDGIYVEQITQSVLVGATSYASALTVKSKNFHGAIIKPSSSMQDAIDLDHLFKYAIFDGFIIDGADSSSTVGTRPVIKVWGTCAEGWVNHIRFQNILVRNYVGGSSGSAIGTSGDFCDPNDSFLEFINVEMTGNGNSGFSNSMYIQTGQNLFQNVYIHDSKGAGIAFSQQNGGWPKNNIIDGLKCERLGTANTKGSCVLLAGSHAQLNLVKNVIGLSSVDEDCINATESGPINNKFYYNTCYGNARYGILVGGSGNDVVGNIAFGNGTNFNIGPGNTQSGNIQVDPLFVNAAAGDFHLQSGSPAINAGIAKATDVPLDYDRLTRPQGAGWDAGAYEFATETVINFNRAARSSGIPGLRLNGRRGGW